MQSGCSVLTKNDSAICYAFKYSSIKKFIFPLPLSINNSLSSSNTGVCVSRISFIFSLCSSKTKPYFFPLMSFFIWFKYNSRFPVFSSCGAEAIYFHISFILSNRSSLFFFEIFILIDSSTISVFIS